MKKKEWIAMLLAGGQGSRLGALTKNIAKPAVSFGGKYRIIDFSLSNCVNSGIDTVGVLIQYRPLALSRYLGTGAAWDMDTSDGGVHVLPPYATQTGGAWYEGTADSIYHNIDFVDSYSPEYVLILSGDHLYQMDYNQMLTFHKEKQADLTVSVMPVPMEEASRFGIMSTDDNNRIVKFAEKPKEPESDLASMGIYIFNWEVLKKALLEDHKNKESSHDFGKNIIPMLLGDGKKLFAYRFEGYWRDIGTIDSYYEAQMNLIKEETGFDLYDSRMAVYSNTELAPAHKISRKARVDNALICNGAIISGKVTNSIIGTNVVLEEGSEVTDSIVLPGAKIERNAKVFHAIVCEDAAVSAGAVLGRPDTICVIE